MTFDDSASLGEARTWLREQALDKGAKCPCCTQFAKVYRRRLNAGMARSLIIMYRTAGTDWQHIPTTTAGGSREEGKLRYWTLVEDGGHTPSGGPRPGMWRVTTAGEAFVLGYSKVPAHALVFDSKLLELDAARGEISIHDALGDHFSYELLMNDPAGIEPHL
jgi:hypothetical protein